LLNCHARPQLFLRPLSATLGAVTLKFGLATLNYDFVVLPVQVAEDAPANWRPGKSRAARAALDFSP
jgi:hypothetical protein